MELASIPPPISAVEGVAGARIAGRDGLRPSRIVLSNRIGRILWRAVYISLFRPSPTIAHGWRRMLLRLFGAKMARGAVVYPSARIWAPWRLEMAEFSSIGPYVLCYSVDRISIGRYGGISQYSYLCTASHDIDSANFTLVTAPIEIGAFAWVAASAFIGPNVIVGEGAVVGACACVFRDVAPWTVVGGNPARPIGSRSRAIVNQTTRR